MPRRKNIKVLAAKIESTSGTAETLTASETAHKVYDYNDIEPTIEFEEELLQGSFDQSPGHVGAYGGKITFKTGLYGDGLAGIPAWASVFLPACRWVATAQVYARSVEDVGSNVKTITIGVYNDGGLKRLRGAAGTFKPQFPTGKKAFIEWEFTGVWMPPTDATILAHTPPTPVAMRSANATSTLGAWSPCFENLSLDAGNIVELRECQTASDSSGYAAAIANGGVAKGSFNPESATVATKDNYGLWIAGTEEALQYELTDGTDTITFDAAKAQRTNVQPGERKGISTDQIDFNMNTGFTITFA